MGDFVQSVLGIQTCHSRKIQEDSSKVPEHFQDLYQQSVSGLNPGQQQQVQNLLREFSPRDNMILEKLI